MAVAVVLPAWPRRIVAAVAGILFALLTLVKLLNITFYEEIGRSFNPVFGWVNIGPAIGVVRDTIGLTRTVIALAALGLGLLLLVGAITASAIHITTVAARHRRDAVRALAALTAVWALSAGLSLQLVPGAPVASASATGLAVTQLRDTQAALRDQRRFEKVLHRSDPEASVPASDLLTGLRGKDVVVAFVESYGQVAVQGASIAPGVNAFLRRNTASLARAGWSTQSAWLNAPGFGGVSQLAHSTLLSGLWVNTEQRYAELVGSHRFTLVNAFDKAGWRTVNDSPEDEGIWPSGTQFYHFDKIYDRDNVGYRGPAFSYSSMPDQYSLAELQRREFGPGHKPVMAEFDMVSSHTPWAPLPPWCPGTRSATAQYSTPCPHGASPRSRCGATPAPCASPSAGRSSTRCRPSPHGSPNSRTPTSCSSCSATSSPAALSPALGPVTRWSSRSSPRPFRVPADSPLALAGRAAAQSLRCGRVHGRLPQSVPRRLRPSLRAAPQRSVGPGREERCSEAQLGPGEIAQIFLHGCANLLPWTAHDPLIYGGERPHHCGSKLR